MASRFSAFLLCFVFVLRWAVLLQLLHRLLNVVQDELRLFDDGRHDIVVAKLHENNPRVAPRNGEVKALQQDPLVGVHVVRGHVVHLHLLQRPFESTRLLKLHFALLGVALWVLHAPLELVPPLKLPVPDHNDRLWLLAFDALEPLAEPDVRGMKVEAHAAAAVLVAFWARVEDLHRAGIPALDNLPPEVAVAEFSETTLVVPVDPVPFVRNTVDEERQVREPVEDKEEVQKYAPADAYQIPRDAPDERHG